MMEVESLFLTSSSLFILLLQLLLFQSSLAKPHNCTPSACGIFPNIRYPLRLKGDPKHCGVLELACENNVTSFYLNSHKFYVKDINYDNYDGTTIMRLVDASVNSDICSFPTSSAIHHDYQFYSEIWPINFMSCPHPLKNSSGFTETTPCQTPNSRFTYIKVGHMKTSEVQETCRVDVVTMTSWRGFKGLKNALLQEDINSYFWFDFKNTSLEEINSALWYGFELYIDPLTQGTKWGFISVMCIICAPRVIISSFIVWLLIYKFRRRHESKFHTIESFLQSDNKLAPMRYSYSSIKKMTRNFRDKLGEGGYGSVYKGTLRSGYHVAVKLLRKSGANGQDFINEIATIGRIHHVNVVKLVGYCAQGSKCALVFDFMPNGSLEKYIFNQENMIFLNWDKKLDIVVGVARGIAYLHQGCDIQILHFDIKPHNILLDDQFIPKISDFGLAKFCSVDKNTMTLTAVRGTIGYVAPELINRGIGRVSYKTDVYSFGMLLIKMVGLREDLTRNDDDSSKYFPCWIYDHLNQEMDIRIGDIDENDMNEEDANMKKIARKMTIVALWCIQMSPDDRPSMNKVLKMLESDVKHLKVPPYPSESCHIQVNEDETMGADSTDSTSLLYHNDAPSVEITIEDML